MSNRPHATSAYSVQRVMLQRFSDKGLPFVFRRPGGAVLHLRLTKSLQPYVAENLTSNQIRRFATLPELRAYLKDEG